MQFNKRSHTITMRCCRLEAVHTYIHTHMYNTLETFFVYIVKFLTQELCVYISEYLYHDPCKVLKNK